MRTLLLSAITTLTLCSVLAGCSASRSASTSHGSVGDGAGGAPGSGLNLGAGSTGIGASLNLGGEGALGPDAGDGSNPQSCAEAAMIGSYVGCDFWPTITANPVWVEFDPAVVIANGSMQDAQVSIDGPAAFHQEVTVPAGGLQTVLLKWVLDLKGPEFDVPTTRNGRLTSSVRVNAGAYHMKSSAPVTAWQFNPLQYTKPGSACPRIPGISECRSSTVDASLLLPSTAMTSHYRVFAYSLRNEGPTYGTVPGGAAITATQDNTTVTVQLGPKCGSEIYGELKLGPCLAAGTGVDAKNAGDIFSLQMNAGDVVELVGAWAKDQLTKNADISGSVINSTAPIQVVSFNAIAQLPDQSVTNADHMEETVLPAEVIGNKYVVVPPTTPNGDAVGHIVRIYGNVDNTHLTYSPSKPADAPDTLMAGDVFQMPAPQAGVPAPECVGVPGHCMMNTPFVVTGDQPFAVASYMVGGTLQMPGTDSSTSQGDPAMTMEVTPQQFRKQYTFLAPKDYLENFADVVIPTGAQVTLDGAPLVGTPTAIDGEWGFVRAKLDNSGSGVHELSTTDPKGIGVQVMGFGYATSYYYPGGLNLIHISVPPEIPVVK
jgi:hypothetical protein